MLLKHRTLDTYDQYQSLISDVSDLSISSTMAQYSYLSITHNSYGCVGVDKSTHCSLSDLLVYCCCRSQPQLTRNDQMFWLGFWLGHIVWLHSLVLSLYNETICLTLWLTHISRSRKCFPFPRGSLSIVHASRLIQAVQYFLLSVHNLFCFAMNIIRIV
jgi:hypothetical protein